jgi:hypothetical protein
MEIVQTLTKQFSLQICIATDRIRGGRAQWQNKYSLFLKARVLTSAVHSDCNMGLMTVTVTASLYDRRRVTAAFANFRKMIRLADGSIFSYLAVKRRQKFETW